MFSSKNKRTNGLEDEKDNIPSSIDINIQVLNNYCAFRFINTILRFKLFKYLYRLPDEHS